MSETTLAIVIIFAEIGVVLFLVFVVWLIFYFRCTKSDNQLSKQFVAKMNGYLPKHEQMLSDTFKNDLDQEAAQASTNAAAIANDEKKLVKAMVHALVTKNYSDIASIPDDLDSLLRHYVKLLISREEDESDEENQEKISRLVRLRKENEALRAENATIKERLHAATTTIENMMGEYASMYDGGQKEGEKRVKNEMYQLKQKLSAPVVVEGTDSEVDDESDATEEKPKQEESPE